MYGLSGSNLAIGVSLVLRDRFTGGARAAQQQMRSMNAEALQIQRQQMEAQRNINAVGAGIGLMAIRGMAQWTKVGAEFGYTMNYISTIADKKGGVGFETLSKKAKTLGADTMFTAREVGDAMKYMAMAGMDTQGIYNSLPAVVAAAGATMSQLGGKGGMADIMTNLMRGFGIDSTEKNTMRVADVITTAVTSANTNIYDLAEAMKYSISTAKDLNVSLEETAAMVMMAGDAGIQGSMAGTAVENMLRYVTRASDESRSGRSGKALNKLGLGPEDLKDANGDLLAMSPLLKTIFNQVQSMGNADKQNILTDLFGVRGKRAASINLRNLDDLDAYINKLNTKATGKATQNLESMMDTLQGAGIQLSSSWESFQIAFTEALEPILKPLLQGITHLLKVVTRLIETPVGKWLTIIAAGGIVAKTAMMGYKAIVLSLRLLHMDTGNSAATMAGRTVSGYNAMTAAATKYGATASAAAGRPGFFARSMGYGGSVNANAKTGRYSNKTGKFIPTGLGDRYSKMAKKGKSVGGKMGGLGKMGKFAGKGMGLGMLGGAALSMGGDAVGGGLGNAMSIGGNAIGMAGTGAMLGSFILPGIGTAVGAIVGGVGSLAYELYSQLSDTADEVEDAKDEAKTVALRPEGKADNWANKAKTVLGMYEGEKIYGRGLNPNMMDATTRGGANEFAGAGIPNPQTNIVIMVDGKKAMERTVTESYYKTLIDLGTF